VERTAQLAGGVDPMDAIARFRAAIAKIPNVVAQPAPGVSLLDMNLVGPVIAVRPYANTSNYWQVYFETNEAIVGVCRDAGWPAPTTSQIVKTGAGRGPGAGELTRGPAPGRAGSATTPRSGIASLAALPHHTTG
jgi:small conductance mechanosensitive channel